jgi:tetratricopeptide (TPR) repeat protein
MGYGFLAKAQQHKIDSLQTLLRKQSAQTGYTADTSRFRTLMEMGSQWQGISLDSANVYHKAARTIAARLHDELREAEAINALGWNRYASGDYQNALSNFTLALKQLEKFLHNGHTKEEKMAMTLQAAVFGNLGNYYGNQGEYQKGLDYFERALRITRQLGNKKGTASKYSNMGNLYGDMGDYQKAISCYFKALKLANEVNHQPLQMVSLINLGSTYMTIHENETALRYFMQAQKLADKLGNKMAQSANFTNIGIIYHEKRDYNNALKYYNNAVNLDRATGNRHSQANNLLNIGSLYQDQKQFARGLEYYLQAKKIFEEINSVHGLAGALNNTGLSYADLGKLDLAEKSLKEAYQIAVELKSLDLLKDSHNHLAVLYELKHQPAKALYHYKEYILYRDSIFNEENTRTNLQKEMQFNYDKKAAADSVKFAKEKELRNIRIAKQDAELSARNAELRARRTQQYLLYGGLALVLVFAGFMFNRFRITQKQKIIIEQKEKETREQKHIIEEKHKEITDSINYAERIQRSFLATTQLLDENLKEYFVLFQPRDVVSGDFYWAAQKPGRPKDEHLNNASPLNVEQPEAKHYLNHPVFYLAVCDSTGHGVPGAIMSILNITCMEKAAETETEPSAILNLTRTGIIERLKKDGSPEGGKDGMDAALLKFDFPGRLLSFALANNPLWLIRNGTLTEFAPDKMPVGKHDQQHFPFTQHQVNLQNGDLIYIFTDGYSDQFGGPKGKKFKHTKLKELLLQHSNLPLKEQHHQLVRSFEQWKGNLEQIDDVCMIGIRL